MVAVTVDLAPLAAVVLVDLAGRRYVLLEPVCRLLGVPVAAQVRRVRRQPGFALRLVGDAHDPAIPAVELPWFLRTLRPRREALRDRIAIYRRDLIEAVERRPLRKVKPAPSRPARRPPARRSRFSAEDVAEMRRLRAGGESYGTIAKRYVCKKGTVCDLLTGRRKPF